MLMVLFGSPIGAYFFPSHGKPRRIDVAFATKAAAATIASYSALEDSGLPGHLPIALQLDIPNFSELVPRIRKPARFPEVIPSQPELALQISTEISPQVNDVYTHFCRIAEQYLATASGFCSLKYKGRGRKPKIVLEPRFSPQSPAGHGCEGTMLRRLEFLRRLEQLKHYCVKGCASSCKAVRLWDIVCKSEVLLNSHSISFPSLAFPSLDALSCMIDELQHVVQKTQAAETSAKVAAARTNFQQDWKEGPSVVYSRVDPQIHSAAYLLQDSDGRLTGNFCDLERLLRAAWLPFFDKYSSQSEPSRQDFVSRYQAYFPDPAPMPLRPFTSRGLRAILSRMKIHSACGPDSWSVADLRNLPDCIFDLLPDLFNAIESQQDWPELLKFGFCS